jgi:hypothetical protein
MAALGGLKGLYTDPQDTADYMDEGVLEAKANTLHPDHGDYGQQDIGYSGIDPLFAPYGPMSVYDGYSVQDADVYNDRSYPEHGVPIDFTPETHSSPYPKGIIQQSWDNPNALAEYGTQLNELHGPDLGGSRFFNGNSMTGHEEETNYTTERYDAPNENNLSSDVAGQLRGTGYGNSGNASGSGNADTTQGYGVLNTLPEFQMGHSIRREQHDSMHFDYTNTHGEQLVPFPGRHPVEQMSLDGPDSPYYQMGNIDGANVVWEGRIGYPTPYQQPQPPAIVAASPGADVWAW